MDEGRKRVLAIVAGILVARHLNTADDLFGEPQGSPRTDAMVAAAVQWADRIMRKIDNVFEKYRATVHLTVALGGSLFLVQRNAEFLAEHGFDALEIFFH